MPPKKITFASDDNYQVTRRLANPLNTSWQKEPLSGGRAIKEPFETIRLRPGLEMSVCSQIHQDGMKIGFEIEKAPISLSYNLSTPLRCTMAHGGGSKTVLERGAGDGLLAYLPKTKGVTEAPPGRLIGLSIYIAQHAFLELFTELPEQLREIDRTRFGASSPKPFQHKQPIAWDTQLVIRQIIQCPYQGDARRIFLEAKVLELIAQKLAELGCGDLEGLSELSLRELDGAREAYHILLNRIEHPPSLQDLSLMVGMNRNKLNRGFKKLYGGTVFKVLRDARLCKAWSLLRHTNYSLSEIALSVGYSDQANFSNAFRRHFGQTPNIVRQEDLSRPLSAEAI